MTESADEDGLTELRDAVIAFNMAATGYEDGRSMSCLVRDDEGRLIAGIDGFTWGGYGMIEWLWVQDAHRRSGLGARLVRAAEHEAAARGCRVIRVNTHTFQAPELYARLGYQRIGSVVDTPVGHGEVFFVKLLA